MIGHDELSPQNRFDEPIDRVFGSANSFMFRLALSMVVKVSPPSPLLSLSVYGCVRNAHVRLDGCLSFVAKGHLCGPKQKGITKKNITNKDITNKGITNKGITYKQRHNTRHSQNPGC